MKKKTHTVAALRQSGNKVRVTQLRHKVGDETGQLYPLKNEYNNGLLGNERTQRGGLIKVEITLKDGKDYTGEALCSKNDQFNRKIGLKIALNRALNGVEVA